MELDRIFSYIIAFILVLIILVILLRRGYRQGNRDVRNRTRTHIAAIRLRRVLEAERRQAQGNGGGGGGKRVLSEEEKAERERYILDRVIVKVRLVVVSDDVCLV